MVSLGWSPVVATIIIKDSLLVVVVFFSFQQKKNGNENKKDEDIFRIWNKKRFKKTIALKKAKKIRQGTYIIMP